jgi:hypothetical protein
MSPTYYFIRWKALEEGRAAIGDATALSTAGVARALSPAQPTRETPA